MLKAKRYEISCPWPEADESINGVARYRIYRPLLETGDVLEWRSNTALGWAIRKFTGKDVNHTGAVFRLREYEHFTADRVYTLEATPHGFSLTYLSRSLSKFKGKVYALPLKPSLDHYRRRIADIQLGYVGIEYDYLNLFKSALGRVSAGARRLFCSEAIGLSLSRAGIITKNTKALWPGDFEQLNVFLPKVRIF